jgi:hypothetical protein
MNINKKNKLQKNSICASDGRSWPAPSDELIFICRFNLLLHNDAFPAA